MGPDQTGNISTSDDQAILLDTLSPVYNNNYLQQRAGCETWSCAWSPCGNFFAWSCGHRIVQLVPWNRNKHHRILPDHGEDTQDGEPKRTTLKIDTGEPVWALAFGSSTADMKPHSVNLNWYRYNVSRNLILATGLNSGRIRTWNVQTGQLILELIDHRDVIRDLKFAPDGSMRMASASRDGTLKLWDLEDDGNMYRTLRGDSKWLYACVWSPDAKLLVSVGDSKSVLVWDVVKLKRMHKLTGHHHDVVSCDFSPDGALLVTSSYDTRIIIWDPHKGEKIQELYHLYPPPSPIFAGGANGAYVRGVSFCHDGRHLSSICDDGYVRFWDLFSQSNPVQPIQVASSQNMLCAQYSPDGMVLAVGTRDGSVTFWLSPMKVLSLQHMCRMAIRRVVPSTKVAMLEMPKRLQNFLAYND